MLLIKSKRVNLKTFVIRGLRIIFGVGKFTVREFKKRLGYNKFKKMPKLVSFNSYYFFLIKFWLSFFVLERDLLRAKYVTITLNQDLRTYQGARYTGFLPVRKRTRTNANTCKKVYNFYLKKYKAII
jgi:ribosomal protein S13